MGSQQTAYVITITIIILTIWKKEKKTHVTQCKWNDTQHALTVAIEHALTVAMEEKSCKTK
jgi:hypothetical protein